MSLFGSARLVNRFAETMSALFIDSNAARRALSLAFRSVNRLFILFSRNFITFNSNNFAKKQIYHDFFFHRLRALVRVLPSVIP